MAVLQVEYLEKLTPERRDHLLNRSKTDVSQVLEEVRAILTALQRDGDAESLRWHRQYKSDLTVSELEVTPAEIEAIRAALIEGEQRGFSNSSVDEIWEKARTGRKAKRG